VRCLREVVKGAKRSQNRSSGSAGYGERGCHPLWGSQGAARLALIACCCPGMGAIHTGLAFLLLLPRRNGFYLILKHLSLRQPMLNLLGYLACCLHSLAGRAGPSAMPSGAQRSTCCPADRRTSLTTTRLTALRASTNLTGSACVSVSCALDSECLHIWSAVRVCVPTPQQQ
jgi:hypothetical protein